MIRNIIFDIGNVLADFRWKEFLADKGCDEQMIKRIAKATVMTPAWNEFDRGELSEEEVFQEFSKNDPQLKDEFRRIFTNITGMVIPREFAVPWVRELKNSGYNVYYLSNFSEKAYNECPEALEFIKYTDGGILSYREKVVKPDPEIYRRLLDRYKLIPEECVFFDDTKANIDEANELGIHGFVFTTKEQAVADLKKVIQSVS